MEGYKILVNKILKSTIKNTALVKLTLQIVE